MELASPRLANLHSIGCVLVTELTSVRSVAKYLLLYGYFTCNSLCKDFIVLYTIISLRSLFVRAQAVPFVSACALPFVCIVPSAGDPYKEPRSLYLRRS